MQYLNLSNQNPNIQENLIYKNGQLHFQRITQIEDSKFKFIEIPLDAAKFKKVVEQALFPINSYAPGEYEVYGIQTVAMTYVVDKSQPAMETSYEEAIIYVWGEQNNGLGIRIILEDTDFQCVLDKERLEAVLMFVNGNPKLLQQINQPAPDTKCKGQYLTSHFECCGQCEVCHCAV
jgi:hypothetical protein